MKTKQLLTASRMASFLSCPRQHYWRYEFGLKRQAEDEALRIGSAVHRGLEALAAGKAIEDVLAAALPDGVDLDAYLSETVSALLISYSAQYPEKLGIHYEVEFNQPIRSSRSFESAGKIDGLLRLDDGRLALIEHKTTSADLAPDSDYWLRLRWNPQLLQYVDAARAMGWDIEVAIYNVIRKPAIRPKEIAVLDSDGKKVVNDSAGQRVYKANGQPRETEDSEKGYVLQTAMETPEQYGARLLADIAERPEFYFARREVPILDQDVEEFVEQQTAVSRMILGCRSQELNLSKIEQAWPRAIGNNCQYCQFQSFCLQNISISKQQPPAGFVIQQPYEELAYANPQRTSFPRIEPITTALAPAPEAYSAADYV